MYDSDNLPLYGGAILPTCDSDAMLCYGGPILQINGGYAMIGVPEANPADETRLLSINAIWTLSMS